MAQRQPVRSTHSEPALGPLFQEMRDTFQLSWTPKIFETLADFPDYVRIAWTDLKPVASTAQYLRASESIWQEGLVDVRDIYSPSYGTGDLQQLGVDFQDQAEIRTALTALLYGEAQTLLAISALSEAIHGRPTGDLRAVAWLRSRTTWSLEPILLASEGALGETERRIYARSRRELNLSETPLGLRVIGRFSPYLKLAWSDISPLFGLSELAAAINDVLDLSVSRAHQLPYRVEATPQRLQKAGLSHTQVDRIRGVLDDGTGQLTTEFMVTALLRFPLGSLRGNF